MRLESPGVDQPTTAVLVTGSLEDILLRIAPHLRHPGWDDCLDALGLG